MKNVILAIAFLLSIGAYTQNRPETPGVFVRVFDMQGKKIGKGKVLAITEDTLHLNRKREAVDIPVERIGSIKTKHSAGNNIAIGAAVGASTMAVIGAASADPDAWILGYTAGEGAAGGAILGGAAGAALGGITILFKRSRKYEINGDKEKLEAFKKAVSR